MNYYSIKDKTHKANFYQAIVNGLAPNQGLYFPEQIPSFPDSFFQQLSEMSLTEIAFEVLQAYTKNQISSTDLKKIIASVFDFEIPLRKVENNIYSLELFHGPTLAFKDVGARFLANSIQLLSKNKRNTVLVATSGDTGSAVANGFLGLEGTDVFVLFPKGKVSELQQKQFTTLGKNIHPIAIDGTFDDCQRLVKTAFSDTDLSEMQLTSANSINIARWIPQSVYYYWAVAQIPKTAKNMVVSVPSGNLGNITSGMLAQKTGLKISRFVVASNTNDTVPDFLKTKIYKARPSVQTLANAMDVGDPNNFPRLLEIYQNNVDEITQQVTGESFSDAEIEKIIVNCLQENNYLLDPHGATGFQALKNSLNDNEVGIFLETAHPGKFYDTVKQIIKKDFDLPEKLKYFLNRESNFDNLSANYTDFKNYLRFK